MCDVYAFDPTPRAVAHVQATAADNHHYHFYAIGLWSEDERMRFFAPRDQRHVISLDREPTAHIQLL